VALIGRAEECARIDGLLDAAAKGRGGALVLRGEPGIGKSALLGYAQERARELGLATLTAAGVESEAELPFAALHALLAAKLDLIELIPEPQARALRAALALGPAADADRLAAYAGTLSLLAEAAERRPLLVAVDDAQWLDRASAEALLFAARRLATEEIVFLFAARDEEGARFDAGGVPELAVAGLATDAALALLQARAPALAPAVARLLVTETSGNPLALLELPALLDEAQLTGRQPIERPLPIGSRIGHAFLHRLRPLPEETRRALLVAAAGAGAALKTVVDAAARLGCGPGALEPAEAAGLVQLAAGSLAFRHPLVRSAVYHAAAPAERRAAHRALAEALAGAGDDDRRAWQLAAAAEGVDEPAADALEQAAERAGARGSYAAQWRALERAVEFTADGGARVRRLLAASRGAYGAGERERALELAEQALPLAHDPLLHADLRHLQATVAQEQGVAFSEEAIVEEAHRVEALDPTRAAKLLGLVLEKRLRALETVAALALAEQRAALCAAEGHEWRLRTLGDLVYAHVLRGNALNALELLPELLSDPARAAEQAPCLIWLERYEEARRTLALSLERARERGRPREIAWSQACTATLELDAGRVTAALAAASDAALLAEQIAAEDLLAFNLPTLARLAAMQGRDAECREQAALAERLAAKFGDERVRAGARMALGLLALGAGRPEQAVAALEPVRELAERNAVGEPGVLPFAPDLVEAYVRLGELDAARALLDAFARQARALGRGWALAAAGRCAGLLADEHELDTRFGEALALAERASSPFERARTELCYGERLRRLNQRKQARPHLRAALEYFEEVGAAPWVERARAELRATGQTVPRRERSAPEELTPQELQIALLVADGRSNRDVAGAMFVSRKTVEYHLSHVYRKLNVHSRAELTRLFAANAARSAEAPAAVEQPGLAVP